MKKVNPLLTASIASVLYFLVFLAPKYVLQSKILDWQNALSGALAFWFFIFMVHHFLNRVSKPIDEVK